MITYFISYQFPHKHFIDLELHIENIESNTIELQLPTWRSGRYQLQYYAKNIQHFSVTNQKDEPINFRKISKDRWEVATSGTDFIKVKYNYYAFQLDGGGSWLDEEMLYINFSNCLLYVEKRINEDYQLNIVLAEKYKLVCGLEKSKNGNTWQLKAKDFYQAIDAPMLASAEVHHQSYQVANCDTIFHTWFHGNIQPDWEKLIPDFKAFTQKQVDIFGSFPEADYHFIFLIPAFPMYHGVEHYNSTVIVLGAEENMLSVPQSGYEDFYNNILGISSHELFHAWNICKIKPKELMPYDFTQENYFKTGFVVEGITTFYGDWLLARSGVWNKSQYFHELKILFKRHFYNFGRLNMSVADSSFDLWLDGYVAGIPNRKGSIYVEGAICCLILDLEIRQATDYQKNMDNVMQLLWERFGKKQIGYSLEDYISLVNEVAGKDMKSYFEECIFGAKDLAERLNLALQVIGCELFTTYSHNNYMRNFGFIVALQNNELSAELIQPNSPADKVLALKDKILKVDNDAVFENGNYRLHELLEGKNFARLTIMRNGKVKEVNLATDGKLYLPEYELKELPSKTEKQAKALEDWLS